MPSANDLRVGYVALSAARDRAAWSGLNYRIAATLNQHVGAVQWVGPLKQRHAAYFKIRQLASMLLLGRRRLRDREPSALIAYARQVAKRLAAGHVDLVFSASTLPIAHLDCKEPIFFWTDATFAGMLGFYLDPAIVADSSIRDGNAAERAALERCKLAIYSSQWAASSAIADYGADRSKVKVVPFGSNLDAGPTYAQVRDIIAVRPSSCCHLLFVGVDWARKGGDIAVEIAKRLNEVNLRTNLVVVGCQPERATLPDFVDVVGFVNKNRPQGRATLEEYYARSHFLMLPSRADCTPIVIGEACSFGLPCIASNVGGIQTVVRDGINGMTFDMISIETVCKYVEGLMADRRRYEQLALSAFDEYEKRLNWDVAGKTIRTLIAEHL